MHKFDRQSKKLILGTALWGWGISKKQAFELLDEFVEHGGELVDTATNYPINKKATDYELALSWLKEWVSQNPSENLTIIVKVGSINNVGSTDFNLSRSTILNLFKRLHNEFGGHLGCVSVHWDNRDQSDALGIAESVEALYEIYSSGTQIGLSGISNPELYLQADPSLEAKWIIQCKENFLTSAAREKYSISFPNATYLAYGINMGGLKSLDPVNTSSVRLRNININTNVISALLGITNDCSLFTQKTLSINELALVYCGQNPCLHGLIIGPRNKNQLIETFRFWDIVKNTPATQLETIKGKIHVAISTIY